MRRTYRSKKETGGGMDPRDVVLAMDEKGSVFDAFYIENIKQTKRDLSVGASTFAASNKVRKRKYVKRLKDQEPIIRDTRESTSRSGYLTPDKSIHLKRELDPFDLLLNSSSPNEVPPKPSKINVFSGSPLHTRGKGKAYRKKAPIKKKFDYSSSKGTDSDKENSFNRSKSDETQNQSDILSHKLKIEKEEKIVSNKIDESIVNIVTDLSLFDNIQNLNSASPLSSTMKDKLSISSVQKSPTCSTPFHKKYRGKSIYKFSPISVDTDDKHYTIAEKDEKITKNKNELNNVPNTTVQFAPPYNKSVDYDEINSPILPSRDVTDKNKTKMVEHHPTITKEISLLQTSEEGPFLGFPIKNSWSIPNINLEAVINKYLERKEYNIEVLQQSQCTDLTNEKKNSNLDSENNQNSSLENGNDASLNPDTRENQFVIVKTLENLISPKLEGNNKSEDQLNLEDCKVQYDETKQGTINRPDEEAPSQTYLENNSIVDNVHSLNKENTLESSQTYSEKNCVVENEHSMNEENTLETSRTYSEQGTSSSDKNKHALSYANFSEVEMEQYTFEPSQTQSEENSSIKYEHSFVEESISEEEIEQNTSEQLTNSEENSTVENESSLTERGTFNTSKDIESFYESCNSDIEMSDIETDNKELLVVLERLNDSVFKKYCNKEANLIGDSSQSDERNNESYSSENSNNILYTSLNENKTLSESSKSTSNDEIGNDLQEDTLMNISNINQDVDFNDEINKPDDDVFVSFVTRRRRNEKTKDSFILSFDNSLTSTSSSDFNKTVLTNTKRSTNSLQGNNDITLSNDAHEQTDGVLVNKSQMCDGDISLLQCENTIIESELSPLAKIRSTGVVSKKSAGLSRQSAKLSAENLNRVSGPRQIDLNSRKSVASKINTAKTRKISKLSRNKMDKESFNEGNDCISRSSIASKNTSIKTRKSYKLSTDNNINNEFGNESNDCTSTNSFVVPTIMTRKSSRMYEESHNRNHLIQKLSPPKCDINPCHDTINDISEMKHVIVLEPGKRWERSLSIYRRVTTMGDHFDQSMLDDEQLTNKGRKYRQSVISTMEMQDTTVSLHNESVNKSRRSTLFSKPSRSTIKILRESNASRISLSSTSTSEDLGFLSEDCDDTLVELSKLSIIDSDHEVTVLEKFNDTSNRITTARDYVLRRCNQTDVIPFDECYPDTLLKNCRKIGEGVYGEVFLWRARDGRARVLKVVPIAGSTKVNGESQKDYHEIISEIVIAMELSAIRAPIIEIEKHLDEGQGVETLDLHSVENATDVFNEVLAVRCVYGSYPSRLLDLWELYDECKGSENDNPAILPADQQFMVLELANAGQDLESYQFHNAEQAYALFQQVAFGLAVAEEAFQFEHRDLHWGNVLIAPTDQKYATFVLRGRAHRVARRGVAATIIDYSLSRLSLRLPADTAALYNDLAADDGLFDAVGDYQFQVYRLMRDKLGNDWKNFEPYTNILWLHYTVDKMITALRYTRTNTKIHKHYIAKLKEIKNRILDYGSAVQYVLTDNEI